MPQPPYLVDQIQVEPGTTTFGSRLIDRDPTDGGLRFADPNVTASLKDLVGLRNVTGVFVVGRAGDGAPYTSIQEALDAIPDSSSAAAPSLVWVLPGLYLANLTIEKDGVILASPGGARLVNSGAFDTLTVAASIAATPLWTRLLNLEIENTSTGNSCVSVLGADSFAAGTVTVNTAPLVAGDNLTVGVNVLTGIAGTRASGSDDFSILGGTTAAIAAEIAAAINDPLNSFASTVEATVLGSVVTLTAVTAGSGGNAITLADSTTPAGGFTLSGATLTGGGAAGSLVASQRLRIVDCQLVASAVGGFQITANTCNYIDVEGGSWRGSSSTSQATATNCAAFRLFGVDWVNNLTPTYDAGADQPSDTSSAYEVKGVGRINDTLSSLTGAGSLTFSNCPAMGNVTIGGDQTLALQHCGMTDLSLDDTIAASLSHTSRGAAILAGGTPTLQETLLTGTAAFVASAAEAVVFDIPQPDATFLVVLDSPTIAEILGVTARSTTGFTISASGVINGSVGYAVMRSL